MCDVVEDNTDYFGFDLTSTLRSSSEHCCSDCKRTAGCKLFVWTNFHGGTCWLKYAKGPKTFLAGAKAAQVSAPTCSKVADNVDYYGNDIKSTSQASVDGCCADCKATPGCKLFVWTTSLGGTCWLKHTQGAASTLPGAKSGVLVPSPPGGCTPPEWNVDYLGGDVASTPRASSSLCCDDCRRTQACRFFTWTAYNGGTCWLKSTKAKTVQATGAVSGSVL